MPSIMPDEFKKNRIGTDARTMRDSTTNENPVEAFLIDGDMPRLAAPVLPQAAPAANPTLLVTPDALLAPPPPGSAPLLMADTPALPTPMLAAPVLSGSSSASTESSDDGDGPAEPRHPMAHLMPEKSKPTEASLRAAQLRAEKKAKARRTKIIVGVVMLAFAAVVGPPAFRWLADAVNEAGSTKTDEEPATTSVPDASTSDTTTSDTGAPNSSAPAASTPGAGGIAGLPGDAQDAVDATNADVTDTAVLGGTTVAP